MLQLVNVGRKSLADYGTIVSRGLITRSAACRTPPGEAGRPRVGDGVRRRRRRDQLHARPADGRRRAGRRVARHPRRGGVLQRHEDDPQRAPGRPARADSRGGDVPPLQRAERRAAARATATTTSSSTIRSRSAMVDLFPERRAKWIWRGHIDLSKPNQEVFDASLPSLSRYDAAIFHMREYVPKRRGLRRRSSGRRRSTR